MTGHPDDQTYANWRGPLLDAFATYHLSAATPVSVAGYVTNFQSILLFVSLAGANGYQLSITYFTDATQNIQTGSGSWTIAVNQSVQMLTPIMGNYALIQLSTTSVAGFNVNLAFTPTNVGVPSTRYPCPSNFSFRMSFSVAAGVTLIAPFSFIAEGPGHYWASDVASSGKLQLRISMLTALGAEAATITQVNTLTSQQDGTFIAPPLGVAVVIQNTDGAVAHSVSFFAAIDGR